MPELRTLLAGQQPNPMFRIAARVHGRDDILHLEFGEPDFATPPHVVEAGLRSLRDERQGYGPGNGIGALRAAIAERVRRVNRFAPAADQVIASAGGTGGLMAALLCLCQRDDEVLVPDPAWAGYDAMLAAAGARMVRYPLQPARGWQPDLEAVEAAISPRSRVLLLNSPSNPGGAVFSRETIERLVALARRHDLWVLSDECYDEFVFEGEHVSPACFDEDGRVVTVGTCSKAYAMTGWRAGWVVAPERLAGSVTLAVSAAINNLPLFVQRAAVAALTGPQQCVREMAAAYRERRDLAVGLLRERGALQYLPQGAFYLLAALSGDAEPGVDSVAFAEALIAEWGIAIAPGVAFGPATARYARVSLASAPEELRVGISGMLDFAATWRQRAAT
ncbi:MAG: pyridoxal phosphate-dependent aminotransferase [Ktedonobacterales bacterium]